MKSKKLSNLFFEIFIVFVGVYGAFLLSNYQQEKREKKLEENFYISFKGELEQVLASLERIESKIAIQIDQIETAEINSVRYDIQPLDLFFHESMVITQAGFTENLILRLKPPIVVSLAGSFDIVQNLQLRTQELDRISKELFISKPHTNSQPKNIINKELINYYFNELKKVHKEVIKIIEMVRNGALPIISNPTLRN